MQRTASLVRGIALSLLCIGSARAAATFALGFEGAPTMYNGLPGEALTWTIYPTLVTSGNDLADGAQGWQFGVKAIGVTIAKASLSGVMADTIYDQVTEDGIVPHDHFEQDLGQNMFAKGAALAADGALANPEGTFPAGTDLSHGAVCWAVFKGEEHQVLQPNGVARLAKLTVTGAVPQSDCFDARLEYVDGYKSAVSKPVITAVTFQSESVDFAKGLVQAAAAWQVCALAVPRAEFALSVALEGRPAASSEGSSCPDTVETLHVEPGIPVAFVANVLVTTANLPTVDGPQGWQISLACEKGCMTIDEASLRGLAVDTKFDEEIDGGHVTHEHWQQPLDAPNLFAHGAALATYAPTPDTADPELKGAISWIVLRGEERQTLYPNTVDRVLKLTCTMPAVAEGETRTCRIFFLDGMKSDVSKPVSNCITHQSGSIDAAKGLKLQALIVTIVPTTGDGGLFSRGDANGDGRFDIADAVYTVHAVLRDPGYPLPCMDAADADANARIELPDAIYLIAWQFRGGPSPLAPFPGCGRADSPEGCPFDATQEKCR